MRFLKLPSAGLAALCATALLVAGCGGHDDKSVPTPTPSTAAPAPTNAVKGIHITGGPLAAPVRTQLSKNVVAAVDHWYQAAYVAGDYPRAASTFRNAFPGFTAGAAAAARRKLGLMSNAAISARIDTVKAGPGSIWLDVLAHKGHAVGVTARVKLVYGTSGSLVSRQVVRGQLNLVYQKGGWRVFAFDITKDQQTPKGGGS